MLVHFFFLFVFCVSHPHLTHSLNQDGLHLLRAKAVLDDPDQLLASWTLRDDTPCNWTAITCDPFTHQVNSITISDSSLFGPFSPFFCSLPSLTTLTLSNSYINSSLSDIDFSVCRNLIHLDLSQNLLVGTIPATLPNITNLRYLDISANNFSGNVPNTFGRFQRLEWLDMASNLLNGTVPSFLGNITTLKQLSLAYNPFAPC